MRLSATKETKTIKVADSQNGVEYYRDADEDKFIPGLMNVRLGPYHIGDIEFAAAFDIDRNKVGKDLSEAIFTPLNCTLKFAEVPHLGVEVMKGPAVDSLGKYLRDVVIEDYSKPVDVADVLKSNRVDVVVNFLPCRERRDYENLCKRGLKGWMCICKWNSSLHCM